MAAASGEHSDLELLEHIDATLSALLTIVLDGYVRTHATAGAKTRSIDVMLCEAGLSTNEVATLLGKSQRAVQSAVQSAKRQKKRKSGS